MNKTSEQTNVTEEGVLSALPARLLIDDTQDYIRKECKGVPVSALGVGGNGPWIKTNCSPHLEVAFRPGVSGELHKQKIAQTQAS